MGASVKSSEAGEFQKTLRIPFWALACMQMFCVWQMGAMFYSTGDLTVGGGTPLPSAPERAVLYFALGYIAGAALCFFFSRRAARWGKLLCLASLAVTLAMFFPLPPGLFASLYCFTAFACTAAVGVFASLAVNAYSLKTALKDGLAATIVSSPFIALIQNEFIPVSFYFINAVSAAALVLMLIGLHRLPARIYIDFLPPQRALAPEKRAHPPALLLWGTLFVFIIACFIMLFSSGEAERVKHGVSLFYVCASLWGLLFALLYFKFKLNPFVLYTVFLGVAALGFLVCLLPFPALIPFGIALQSASCLAGNLSWFIAGMLFEKWSSRLIAPATMLIALATVLIHSALLEAMRERTELLYAVCAGIALALLLVYFVTEPYFMRVWIDKYRAAAPPQVPVSTPAGDAALTRRENEITLLVVQGYTNADIAKLLFISEHTVKTHVKSIYQKLEVHSRFELAAKLNRQSR